MRLNLTTTFTLNGDTIDHLHVRRRYWGREAKTQTINGELVTVKGIYRVLYALHCVDTPGPGKSENADCRKLFVKEWFDDDPAEPWNKSDQWAHENGGYVGTFVA